MGNCIKHHGVFTPSNTRRELRLNGKAMWSSHAFLRTDPMGIVLGAHFSDRPRRPTTGVNSLWLHNGNHSPLPMWEFTPDEKLGNFLRNRENWSARIASDKAFLVLHYHEQSLTSGGITVVTCLNGMFFHNKISMKCIEFVQRYGLL